jgi:outer membrane receptor for ferrienterochelin and colicins
VLTSLDARRRAGLAAMSLCCLTWIAAPLRLGAQAGGAIIAGSVTDRESGAGVDGAVVLLRGTLLRARSDAQGRFWLANVPVGRYTITVLAIGFASDSVPGVTVGSADTVAVTIALRSAPVGLADIVVTASRAPERSGESGASVTMLSAQELVRRNATTLDQALQFEPGVTFNAGQMDIRGSTGLARGVGSRVLLLLDGHPILSGDGGEIDFESLPLLDVDRVEVVKGAYSAQYGSNALGGVVNVLTAPIADRSQTTLRLHYDTWQMPDRYRYSSEPLDAKGVGIQHSQRVGAVGARVFVGRELSDGYRQDDESIRWLGRAKLSSPEGSAHPWDTYLVWAQERLGEFFTWRSANEPFQVDDSTRNDYELDRKLLTGASFTPIARATALLRVSPYVNYNSVQNYFHDNNDHHRATRLGGSVDLSLRPEAHHALDFGVDLAHTIVESNFLGPHRIHDDAVFAQDEVLLSDRVTGSLGFRLDYHRATGGQDEWSPSPKVSLTYRPAEWLSTRMSVGHGYRAPSAIEQFVNTTQFGIRVIPNPDLRGERAWSGEVGLTGTAWSRLRLDASLFQNEYRDLIGPASSPGQLFVFQFRNVNRARVRGVDVSLKTPVVANLLDLEASYLWLDSRDLDTHLPLPYRSRHNVTGTVSALDGLVDVDVRFRSRVQQVLAYPLDPRGNITVVDLRLGYRLAGVALQAKVSNLFQTFYVDVMERNPGAPRQVSLAAFRQF